MKEKAGSREATGAKPSTVGQNDIVDRLRSEGSCALRRHLSLGMWALCAEAADEIERLRKTVDRTVIPPLS